MGKIIEAIMTTEIGPLSFTYSDYTNTTINPYVNGGNYFQQISQVERDIWRPKVQNNYSSPYCAISIDGGVFDFNFSSKLVFSKKNWRKSQQDKFIPFNIDLHQKDLQKHLRIQPDLDSQTCDRITNFVIKYFGFFCK